MYSPKTSKYGSQGSNIRDSIEVPFNKVFAEDSTQEEVFEAVGKNVVLK
jgi:hypothetical protein